MYNPEKKFIEVFPSLIEFSELPSELMWAVYLLTNPESKWAHLPEFKKKELVKDVYPEEIPQELIDEYRLYTMSPNERLGRDWKEELESILRYCRSLKLQHGNDEDMETAEKKMMIMSKYHTGMIAYIKVQKEIEKENKQRLRGGQKESLAERKKN